MRIDEIASAEDQIALFKLITDKVWQALGDQQRAEAEADAKAAQPLKAKLKPISPKKTKPPAARTVPKPTVKVAPSAKAQPQPERTPSFGQPSQNIQAQSTKQKQNSNRDKEPEPTSFDELNRQ